VIGQERPGLGGGRQFAGHVQGCPAKEGGVVGQLGGRNSQLAQPGQNVMVDEIVWRNFGPGALQVMRNDDGGQGRVGTEADDERRFANTAGGDLPVRGHGRDDGVEGLVGAEAGDVLGGAVRELCLDPQSVGFPCFGLATDGFDAKKGHPRLLDGVELGPARDPAAKDLVFGTARRHAPATLVGGLPGRLAEQQAGVGVDDVQPPAGGAAEQEFVVEGWVGPKRDSRKPFCPFTDP